MAIITISGGQESCYRRVVSRGMQCRTGPLHLTLKGIVPVFRRCESDHLLPASSTIPSSSEALQPIIDDPNVD